MSFKSVSKTRFGTAGLVLAGVSLMTFAAPAWAYLDPGTGSMIISAIVGLFATVGLALKTYWYKIKAFFRRDGHAVDASRQPANDPAGDSAVQAAERSAES